MPSEQAVEPFRPHATGMPYLRFIGGLADALQARSYLEVGTRRGGSLALINCASVAVDPKFVLTTDVLGTKEFCLLFQMTSDAFFARYDTRQFFPAGVDLAFLDGLHRFEFLLRDFINAEKASRRNSIVLMHDCLPASPRITARGEPIPDDATSRVLDDSIRGSAGDVWKIIPILQKWRPDLILHCFDCPPTGIVAVTGLDPASQVLDERYFEIVAEFAEKEQQPGWFDSLYESIDLQSSRNALRRPNLTKYFWL